MDNYLVDREILGQFIDELIKKKPLNVNSVDELNNFREQQIKVLDDRIGTAIFGQLTEEQTKEINEMLDRGEENPDVFEDFFEKSGVDLEKTMQEVMETFGREFLEGGQNV